MTRYTRHRVRRRGHGEECSAKKSQAAQMKVWFRAGNIVGGVVHLPSIPRWPVCIGPPLIFRCIVQGTAAVGAKHLGVHQFSNGFSFHNKQSWPSASATAPPSVAAAGGRWPGAELAEGGELTLTARAGNLSMVKRGPVTFCNSK